MYHNCTRDGEFNKLILILIVFVCLCCKSEDKYSYKAEFRYTNQTQLAIEGDTKSSYSHGVIMPGSTESIIINESASKKDMLVTDVIPPYHDQTALLFFGEELCDTLSRGTTIGTGEGVMGIENYVAIKNGRNDFTFTYVFTDVDLAKADSCR